MDTFYLVGLFGMSIAILGMILVKQGVAKSTFGKILLVFMVLVLAVTVIYTSTKVFSILFNPIYS